MSLGDSLIGSALVRSNDKLKESLVEIEISPGTDFTGLVDNEEESKTRKSWSWLLEVLCVGECVMGLHRVESMLKQATFCDFKMAEFYTANL